MERSPARVLVCATMWWPLSARLAMAFLRHGCQVSSVSPPGHPLRFVSEIKTHYLYRGLSSAASLRSAIEAARPSLVVPGDDGVVWQLHELHQAYPELRPLIERSLGAKDSFPQIRSRGAFLTAARDLGIRIPTTRAIASEADLEPWSGTAVLKLDGTWGGTGVAIARSQPERVQAFRALSRPTSAATAWKRWLVNRDPIALWMWGRREAPRVTIQDFVQGRPANTMFACWQGEVLGMVTVDVIAAQGATGAATIVRLIRNPEIERAARLLAGKFLLSGFHGLDFILDAKNGEACLIEINPRCTQLGHLLLPGQGDLAEAICAKLEESPNHCESSDAIQCQTIAFFPQAFNWNPKNPHLKRAFQDVPWEEPALVRELLRASWPERQWLYRLYHSVRPLKREQEVEF